MNADDPKLTAYALDELDEAERQAVTREASASTEAQREIQQIQTIARLLRAEFGAELQHRQDADVAPPPLSANLNDIRDDPWLWTIARPLAIAATLALLAIVGAIALGTHTSRSNTAASSPPRTNALELEATADNESEFPTPEHIANPWSAQMVKGIERVVIGELDANPQRQTGEIRVLEIMHDPYRVEHLKRRLGSPVVSKTSSDGPTRQTYELMFLDPSGHLVACARFYHAPGAGFVLQPEKNAYERAGRYFIGSETLLPGNWQSGIDYRGYAIQFSDWSECIGYAPSA